MLVVIARTLLVFIFLILLLRILGKRQMGELELSELVVSVLMANLAAGPLQDTEIPFLNGLLPVLVLFACELIVSDLTLHCIRLRGLISGKPCMLIRNGRILQSEMRRARLSVDELNEKLRACGILDISKVKYAVLETDGTLSAIPYASESPVTAAQMGMNVPESAYPFVIVEDGKLKAENLSLSGHDEKWLSQELRKRGVSDLREIFVLTAFDDGTVYFLKKESDKHPGGKRRRTPA